MGSTTGNGRKMKSKRRFAAVVLVAASAICLAIAAVIGWRVHRVLRQTSAAIDAEENFAVDVRPVNLSSGSRFDWIAAPAVFSSGAPFHDRLYLCGPSGLYEYSNTGDLLHVYRVGQQLPAAPLVSMAIGTLSDSHQPELLIATAGAGVLAFDGTRFRQIAALASGGHGAPDIEANTVTALLPLPSGRLLIGTAKRGLLVYDGKRIRYFQSTLKDLYITALAGSEAELWIGTLNHGLYHWQGGDAAQIDEAQGLPDPQVNAIALDDGVAYVATPVGVAEVAEGRVQRVLAKGVFAQAVYREGKNLIVGSIDQGILTLPLAAASKALRPAAGARIAASNATPDEAVASAGEAANSIVQFFSSSDTLYAVAQDGLYQQAPQSSGWRKALAPSPSMLTDRNISALAVDASGRLWVGYFDRGLDIVSPNLDRASHVENGHIYCINRIVPDAARHTVNVATANGLAVFDADGRERAVMGKSAGLIADHVTDVALYRGGMAIATPAGLTFMDSTGAHSLYVFQGLVNNHVYALGMHGDRLLAGTLGGVSILDSDNVSRNLTTATSGLRHNWITAIASVDDGWLVGTYGAGVEHLSADNRFETTEATLEGVEVNPNAMLVTPDHVLAGTLGSGLMVFNRKTSRWRTFTTGLPSLNVTAFAAGGGNLYIGTDNGLVRIPEERLDE
jgi:ligand-binding sensor domain-containing protein